MFSKLYRLDSCAQFAELLWGGSFGVENDASSDTLIALGLSTRKR